MSKYDKAVQAGRNLARLVNWGPETAATADDIARFGPNASRVRQLLRFARKTSPEAEFVVRNATKTKPLADAYVDAVDDVIMMFDDFPSGDPRSYQTLEALNSATDAMTRPVPKWLDNWGERWGQEMNRIRTINDAATAEALSSFIPRETYRIITNPLNAGRAVDIMRGKPRLQGTPFLDVVKNLAERGLVSGPRDIVRASRIAQQPGDVLEIALTLIADGMEPRAALRAARSLAGGV